MQHVIVNVHILIHLFHHNFRLGSVYLTRYIAICQAINFSICCVFYVQYKCMLHGLVRKSQFNSFCLLILLPGLPLLSQTDILLRYPTPTTTTFFILFFWSRYSLHSQKHCQVKKRLWQACDVWRSTTESIVWSLIYNGLSLVNITRPL